MQYLLRSFFLAFFLSLSFLFYIVLLPNFSSWFLWKNKSFSTSKPLMSPALNYLRKTKKPNFSLKLNRRIARIRKKYCSMDLLIVVFIHNAEKLLYSPDFKMWYSFFLLRKSSKKVQCSNDFMFHSHMRFWAPSSSETQGQLAANILSTRLTASGSLRMGRLLVTKKFRISGWDVNGTHVFRALQ